MESTSILQKIKIQPGLPCCFPDPNSFLITEDDPAIKAMTDFTSVLPITIEPKVSIENAVNKMRVAGVRLLLVTDEYDHIDGVITSYDIQGEKPIKYSQENGIRHDKISVDMLMVPLDQIPAFDYNKVQQALVRHVIAAFRELDRPHVLVIQSDEGGVNPVIRGMFSSTQVSKLLDRSVYTPLHAGKSLAEIQHDREHPSI